MKIQCSNSVLLVYHIIKILHLTLVKKNHAKIFFYPYFLSSKHLDILGQQRIKVIDINQELHFSLWEDPLMTTDSKDGGRMGPFPLALLIIFRHYF